LGQAAQTGLRYRYRTLPELRRRVESIYSKQSEEPKTACQRKPTAPLALTLTEQRNLQPLRAPAISAPPKPTENI
jgi:hypothetical protein